MNAILPPDTPERNKLIQENCLVAIERISKFQLKEKRSFYVAARKHGFGNKNILFKDMGYHTLGEITLTHMLQAMCKKGFNTHIAYLKKINNSQTCIN
jgi:hypothetical protein